MSQVTTVAFTVRMPKPMKDALDKLARREMSSANREILVACRAHIDAKRERVPR